MAGQQRHPPRQPGTQHVLPPALHQAHVQQQQDQRQPDLSLEDGQLLRRVSGQIAAKGKTQGRDQRPNHTVQPSRRMGLHTPRRLRIQQPPHKKVGKGAGHVKVSHRLQF